MRKITITLADHKSKGNVFVEQDCRYIEIEDSIVARTIFNVLAFTMQLYAQLYFRG